MTAGDLIAALAAFPADREVLIDQRSDSTTRDILWVDGDVLDDGPVNDGMPVILLAVE